MIWIEKYPQDKEYFLDNNELWYNMFKQVKEYINENHKRPSKDDKNKEIKQMGQWISKQQTNYKKKNQIMKQQEIYDEWTKLTIQNLNTLYPEYMKEYKYNKII